MGCFESDEVEVGVILVAVEGMDVGLEVLIKVEVEFSFSVEEEVFGAQYDAVGGWIVVWDWWW